MRFVSFISLIKKIKTLKKFGLAKKLSAKCLPFTVIEIAIKEVNKWEVGALKTV